MAIVTRLTHMLISLGHLMTLPAQASCLDSSKKGVSSTLRTAATRAPKTSFLLTVRYLMDSWFGAVLGGGVYGAWAVWANWGQGAKMALTIGAAHWLTSTLLTFFGTMAMRSCHGSTRGWTGSLRAFVGGLGLTYASLFAVHGLLGTERLLLTLAPGIVPNILFCASYALLLKRTATSEPS